MPIAEFHGHADKKSTPMSEDRHPEELRRNSSIPVTNEEILRCAQDDIASDASDAANRSMLLTPPGSAAITVVRLIGPNVPAFLSARFSRRAKVGRCVHGELRD